MVARTGDGCAVILAPFGAIRLRVADGALVAMELSARALKPRADRDPLVREVSAQLRAYFKSAAHRFDLPLDARGTDYQQRVWRALRRIRRGAPVSYGELARRLHSSPRAIGGACRANPIALIVPCHRVVAGHGTGGFMGASAGRAIAIKRWLLEHETR